MDYTAVGQTTHLAARMEQMAMPGSALLTGDTLRLAEGYVGVKALGPVPVKAEHPAEHLRRAGRREQAHEHLAAATTMYREMDMGFWLTKAEAELAALS
jgi:class 3 adenylate cyclase